jgi:protein-S-isoprenylcysteine O-methyltransferase Ste14
VAARILWGIALVALLLSFADAIALTKPGRKVRYVRAATATRLWLAAAEATLLAAAILADRLAGSRLRMIGDESVLLGLAGAVVSLGGAGLAIAAKRRLGRFFTGNLAIKEGHALVTDGLYGWVRHPIYLGVLLFFLGTGPVWNSWPYVALTLALAVVLALQIRTEEEVLGEGFGPAWTAYCRRVPALFPFPRPPATSK